MSQQYSENYFEGFSSRLSKLVKYSRETPEEFAERFSAGSGDLNNMLYDDIVPNMRKLQAIAKYYEEKTGMGTGAAMAWLMCGERIVSSLIFRRL